MDGERCGARRSGGGTCQRYPMAGSERCQWHLVHPAAKAKAAVRGELARWGLGDAHVDPGETLLRLLSQSVNRAEFYAELLEDQYLMADAGETSTELPGGIRALIGHKYALDREGNPVAIEEAIRALVELEATERDRAANFAAKAIAAGLAERQVRIAEQQGPKLANLLREILADPELALTDEQRAAIPAIARRRLALVS